MLPIFHILGTNWVDINISSLMMDEFSTFDLFTKINFTYPNAVASLKVGKGVKSEGELIIPVPKVTFMYLPLGGKQNILKYDLKTKITIDVIFIN